jgi:hypothetical protein
VEEPAGGRMRPEVRVGPEAAVVPATRPGRRRLVLLCAAAAALLAGPAVAQSDLEVIPADASALSKPYRSTIPQFRRRPPPAPVPAAPAEPAPASAAEAPSWRDPPNPTSAAVPDAKEPPRFLEPDEPEAEEPPPPRREAPRTRRAVAEDDAREPAPAARPAYIGVWGPNVAACAARRSARRGFIPAVIQAGSAVAGPTTCRFGEVRRAGGAWVTAASCRNAGRRWTSQVRLTVEGNRLTWTSERGATSYLRCGRR